jgi:hypothetical protein
VQSGIASALILIDRDEMRAEGEATDLNHGMPFVKPMLVVAGGYERLAGCDVIVICAGANQRPGETRLDLLHKNAGVFRDILPKVVAACPQGGDPDRHPVDILTEIAAELARWPHGRVIGSGTLLDTARFRYNLGEFFDIGHGATPALANFGSPIVLLVTGAVPNFIAAAACACAMVVARVLTPPQDSRGIDWNSVLPIGGMIPLSTATATAMTETGAAQLVADRLIASVGPSSPLALLAAPFVLTATLGQIIGNPATALIVAPIALARRSRSASRRAPSR